MANIYMIGDLARHTKYSIDTLNYYLRIGLIKEVGRSERSNYRYFDDSTVEQIKRIQELRMQKVPVKELLRRKENGVL
ncbi:MerR family transcriptional regulator [candidate division KSB1 bacterium]|nr:MerR family transcriptional regulator [candidate division KSB1 bacterium]